MHIKDVMSIQLILKVWQDIVLLLTRELVQLNLQQDMQIDLLSLEMN